ncbi:uncharacterized protein [Lolium perenne]|uniref:uncharacterized protein n=1 Tax=Lolium perenne TaxID=4522 RepID=UPI0021EAE7E8|nr:uncharacterized protein LOC127305601 [Lolium perenne]XP_051192060.1 uncharacterized protein LOC127305601 [Lolium perenne]XP_051192061.1 uncharacterized protein LOC127305601 [Lolium perenne]
MLHQTTTTCTAASAASAHANGAASASLCHGQIFPCLSCSSRISPAPALQEGGVAGATGRGADAAGIAGTSGLHRLLPLLFLPHHHFKRLALVELTTGCKARVDDMYMYASAGGATSSDSVCYNRHRWPLQPPTSTTATSVGGGRCKLHWRLLQGAVAAATIGVGASPAATIDGFRLLHQRRRLLQGVSPHATRSCGGCYHRRRRLVQGASPAATGGGGGCFKRRRLLQKAAAAAASRGHAGFYMGHRQLLPSAAAPATRGHAGCYMGHRRLLPSAAMAATCGCGGGLLEMASTFSGGSLWARGVAAMGFGVAALVPGQQLARCC